MDNETFCYEHVIEAAKELSDLAPGRGLCSEAYYDELQRRCGNISIGPAREILIDGQPTGVHVNSPIEKGKDIG